MNYINQINLCFGVITMALLDCSVVQKKVFYLDLYNNKNSLIKLFGFLRLGKFRVINNHIELIKKPKQKNFKSILGSMDKLKKFFKNLA